MKHEVKRPCADCYRLVRTTFEGSVGKMLIRHLRDYNIHQPPIDEVLIKHLREHDREPAKQRHLSCDRCGTTFVSSSAERTDESWGPGQTVFWVGWMVNHQGDSE